MRPVRGSAGGADGTASAALARRIPPFAAASRRAGRTAWGDHHRRAAMPAAP